MNDSWVIEIKDEEQDLDTIKISVDSISIININGIDLKVLYVTYFKLNENMHEVYSSRIIEKIGDIQYMFNWFPWSSIACDVNYTNGLRCYEDQNIGFYSNTLAYPHP